MAPFIYFKLYSLAFLTLDGFDVEFKLILSGSLEYVIDKESTTLNEGDAIFFDARLPHFPKSTSEEVKMLVIYFILPD